MYEKRIEDQRKSTPIKNKPENLSRKQPKSILHNIKNIPIHKGYIRDIKFQDYAVPGPSTQPD